MRDFKGIKRQRNRNRNGGGGGGKPQHNANRAFDSNGPDGVKVRGAAQHVYEKYQQLARDAHTTGDRVLAENHLQHAEHYFRVLRAMQPQRPLADIVGRDQYASGYDIDFEDETGAQAEAAETDGEIATADQEGERPGEERGYREPRQRDEWRGEDRFDRDRGDRGFRGQRDDRFRDDRQRGRDDRRFDRPDRGDRPERYDRERPERPERDRFERDRPERDRFERGEPRQNFRVDQGETRQPASEAAGEASGPVLRADDGDVSHAPAFLQTRPADEQPREARRPRRRRSAEEASENPEAGEA